MKLRTFYKIFYQHRYKKAKLILKPYLLIVTLLKYLINLIYLPKIINLDKIEDKLGFRRSTTAVRLLRYRHVASTTPVQFGLKELRRFSRILLYTTLVPNSGKTNISLKFFA